MFTLPLRSQVGLCSANVRRPKGLDVPLDHRVSAGDATLGEQEMDDPWHARPAAQPVTHLAWTPGTVSPDRRHRCPLEAKQIAIVAGGR